MSQFIDHLRSNFYLLLRKGGLNRSAILIRIIWSWFFTRWFLLMENTLMRMSWLAWNEGVRTFDSFRRRFGLYPLAWLFFPKECHVLGYLKFLWNTDFLSFIAYYQFAATATFRNLAALFLALWLLCCILCSSINFVVCSTFYPIIFLLFAAVHRCIRFFEGLSIKTDLF